MPMYNLIEHSDIYSKASGSLWKFYKDEPASENNGCIVDFPADINNSISNNNNNNNNNNSNNNNGILFKFKKKITGETGSDGTKNVNIMVPLKYLSNFWRTLKI